MTDGTFMKLSSAYLTKYFARKSLAYKKWEITIDGVTHFIDNQQVIDLILSSDARSQKLIADSIFHLDEVGIDINIFLKNLVQHSCNSIVSKT